VNLFLKRCGLFITLVLCLSGCFQEAGEAFQPVDTTEIPLELPDATNTLDAPINTPVDTPSVAEGSFPTTPPDEGGEPALDMTIISPTRVLPTTPTPEPSSDQVEGAGSEGTEDVASPTPAFITPSSPLGQVTVETPVPGGSSELATATPSGLITPTSFLTTDNTSSEDCTYTVQRGDTLFRIATNNNTTVAEVTNANPGIDPNLIQPGQVLNLPNCGTGAVVETAPTEPPVVNAPAGGTTYTVQRGDTLYSISLQFGVTIQAIVEANNLANPNSISPGQELIIPPPSNP
jgi:LysM repeat protein